MDRVARVECVSRMTNVGDVCCAIQEERGTTYPVPMVEQDDGWMDGWR